MNRSTLDIGELIFAGFHGTHITPQLKDFLIGYPFGGLILFARNITSYTQWHDLISALQQIRSEQKLSPLLIAVDEEGGTVSRLPDEADTLPGARALAQTDDTSIVELCGYTTGMRLRHVGCNVNFAPVLDVNSTPHNPGIGIRSYGITPHPVTRYGLAAMQGLSHTGIFPCAKHFPGKGAITRDSHKELPVCTASQTELTDMHLPPFQAAVKQNIPFIMTSHACYPALTDTPEPATLSHRILTGILRQKMGYTGIIISDDLEMGAMTTCGSIETVTYQALSAGCDMALICHTIDKQIKTYNYLQKKVFNDESFYNRCAASIARVKMLKQRLPLHECALPADGALFASDIAQECVTKIADTQGLLPIQNKNASILVAGASFRSAIEVEIIGRKMFDIDNLASSLKQSFRQIDCLQWNLSPTQEQLRAAYAVNVNSYDYILLISNNSMLYPLQKELLDYFLLKAGDKSIFVAVKNPEDSEQFPVLRTHIATYGYNKACLSALIKLLAVTE